MLELPSQGYESQNLHNWCILDDNGQQILRSVRHPHHWPQLYHAVHLSLEQGGDGLGEENWNSLPGRLHDGDGLAHHRSRLCVQQGCLSTLLLEPARFHLRRDGLHWHGGRRWRFSFRHQSVSRAATTAHGQLNWRTEDSCAIGHGRRRLAPRHDYCTHFLHVNLCDRRPKSFHGHALVTLHQYWNGWELAGWWGWRGHLR